MRGRVEAVELVPADEVPVAEVVVEHQLATALAADLPNERADAHLVCRVVEAGVDVEMRQSSAIAEQVDAAIEVGLRDGAQFGAGFGVLQIDDGEPEERRMRVVTRRLVAVAFRQGGVVVLANAVAGGGGHGHADAVAGEAAADVAEGRVDGGREAFVA